MPSLLDRGDLCLQNNLRVVAGNHQENPISNASVVALYFNLLHARVNSLLKEAIRHCSLVVGRVCDQLNTALSK
ncbi:hypothetical protein XELAEV_18041669mg [Xenopus laevis]|uniref:Uncharacterized protein n=1 Tax=Xenopus laevis TaxID=8355 RepID=A0A974C2E8_XENLA|nr:hypothetical protein XELAEV_18041669mg [Xenopus laevis]